nr:Unknown function [Penicillium sclerotiorum]
MDSSHHFRDLKVYREILMMRVMNSITDKPDWDQKVFNEEITSKWRKEISESGQDVSTTMMDFVIGELQWRAELLKINKSVNVFTIGVEKSDTAISDDLKKALIEAAAPLEDVPEDQKDYHPGSDQKVVDLVHPSLFPLVYGHTRILRDEVITLDNCLGTTGQGEVLPTPSKVEIKSRWTVSNFNGSHVTLSIDARANRIEWDTVEYESDQEEEEPEQGPEEDDDTYWERHWAWQTTQKIEQPEPGSLQKFKLNQTEKIDIRELFGKTGLQVIVKMANIELTPEKPEYEGGSWHVEGQLPGHRKILAFFLVDPHLKIISTANIPPQQMSWGAEKAELTRGVIGGRLPVELQDMVLQEGVLQPLMTMDEAKKFRWELMEERSVKAPNQNEAFEMGSFCLLFKSLKDHGQ